MASRFPSYPTVFQSLTFLSHTLLQASLRHPGPRVPSYPQREASSCWHVGGSTVLLQDRLTWGKMNKNKTDYSIRRKSLSRGSETCRPPHRELRDHHRRTDLRTPLLGPEGNLPS